MASNYKVKAVFTGDAKGLKGALNDSSKGYDKVGKAQDRLKQGSSGLKSALATASVVGVAAVGAIGAAAVGAVQHFSKFQTAWTEVTTLFDGSVETLSSVRTAIDGLATAYGVDQVEGAKAYYQIVSAGAEAGAQANAILEQSVKASVAGVTDMGTAADGLTTVMNAYGLSAEDAGAVSDKMFATVKRGKTTFGELASNIGKVAPIASASNVSLEELLGSVQELTKKGVSTAESMTQMKALIQSMIKPTGEAAKITKQLGIDWGAAALESNGLAGQIELLNEATGGNAEQITKVLGSVEAYQAYVVLAEGNTENFKEAIDATTNSLGSTDVAFEKMSNTLDFQGNRVKATFGTLITSVGETISSNLDLVGAMGGVADALESVGPWVTEVAGIVAGVFKSAIEGAVTLLGMMWERIKSVGEIFGGWDVVFEQTGKVVYGVIVTVVQVFGTWWNVANDVWDLVMGFLKWLFERFKQLISFLGDVYNAFVEGLSGWIQWVWEKIQALWGWFSEQFGWLGDILKKVSGFFADAFTGWIKWVIEKISDFLGWIDGILSKVGVDTGLQEGFDNVIESLSEGFESFKGHTANAFQYVKTTITDAMGGAADGSQGFFASMKDNILKYFGEIGVSREEAMTITDNILGSWDSMIGKTATANENTEGIVKSSRLVNENLLEGSNVLGLVTDETEKLVDAMGEGESAAKGVRMTFDEIANSLTRSVDAFVALTGRGGGLADALSKFRDVQDSVSGIIQTITKIPSMVKSGLSGIKGAFGGIAGLFSGGADAQGATSFLGKLTNLGPQIGTIVAGISTLVEVGKKLFGDKHDRVTVGVSASGTHSALEIDRTRAQSGLQLFAHSRRAGDEGDKLARDMLKLFSDLDSNLVAMFEELGVTVDFTSTKLRTGRSKSNLRPSDIHDPFGSVEYDKVNQGDLETAALDFVRAWVTELLPQLGGELQDTLLTVMREATSPEDILGGLQDVIAARKAQEAEAIQLAINEAVAPLVAERGAVAQDIASLGTDKLIEESRIASLRETQAALIGTTQTLDAFRAGIGKVDVDYRNSLQRFNDLANTTQTLARGPLDATANIELLNSAMAETGNVASQLVTNFHELESSIAAQLETTTKNIEEAFLSETELTERRKQELDSLFGQLERTTDAETIDTLTRSIDSLVNSIFEAESRALEDRYGAVDLVRGELESEEEFLQREREAIERQSALLAVEQEKLQDTYLAYVEQVRELSTAQIQEGIETVLEKQRETADYVDEKISTASDNLAAKLTTSESNLAAINTQLGTLLAQYNDLNERIASAGGEFVEAAETFSDAVDRNNSNSNSSATADTGEVNA